MVSSIEKKSISCLPNTGIKYRVNETFLVVKLFIGYLRKLLLRVPQKWHNVKNDWLTFNKFQTIHYLVCFAPSDFNFDKLSAESFGILIWFRLLHLENLE